MAYGTWTTSIPGSMNMRRWYNGQLTHNTTSAKTKAYQSLSRSGSLSPGYFSKRKKNPGSGHMLLPDNALSQNLTFDRYVYGIVTSVAGLEKYIYTGEISGVAQLQSPSEADGSFSAGELTSLDNRAKMRLRDRLKDQKVNLLQVIAERKQTIGLISDGARTIAKVLLAIKKGDLVSASHVLGIQISKRQAIKHKRYFEKYQDTIRRKNHSTAQVQKLDQLMANGVLALNFGIKPLLSDIYGSAEQLANMQYREVWTQSAVKVELQNAVQSNSGGIGFDWTQEGSRKATIKYNVKFSVENLSLHTTSQTGFTNPLAVAWELVPWSFVIDWFLPIGNYLSSLDATLGLRFVSGTKTTILEYELKRDFYLSSSKPKYINGSWFSGTAVASKRGKNISRVKLTSFPGPVLPEFRNPFSVTRAINSIALLTQLRR